MLLWLYLSRYLLFHNAYYRCALHGVESVRQWAQAGQYTCLWKKDWPINTSMPLLITGLLNVYLLIFNRKDYHTLVGVQPQQHVNITFSLKVLFFEALICKRVRKCTKWHCIAIPRRENPIRNKSCLDYSIRYYTSSYYTNRYSSGEGKL